MSKKIKKILVANRGEIALRVIRAAKELGIKTVAVYSDADKDNSVTFLADEAVYIGESEAKKSYLDSAKILAACKSTGADALHPGFGFLSENADFARACAKAGITFIGPSPDAMELMGDKLQARAAMKAAGVPTVPGSEGALSSLAEAKKIAAQIGFPVILKASAGGGGKGMRVAQNEKELEQFYDMVKREALNYFSDDSVFIEKYAKNPHHIEVQIIADQHGNICHLFERECSVQRRHQKVIEEAPSPFLHGHDEVREKLFQVAVQGAKRIGYTNAGTMEFVMDGDRNFYFLEMNTRIQVEHPVSEMITGIDLVKEQIRIAQGEKLSFNQEDLRCQGAAMECRLYAEHPRTFLPSPGPIEEILFPGGPFVRVDSSMRTGTVIPLEYDPMIAKIITWGRTREEGLNRMRRALGETAVGGCLTNIEFLLRCMDNTVFQKGDYTTGFIQEQKAELLADGKAPHGLSQREWQELLANQAALEKEADFPAPERNWWHSHER